MNASLPSVAQFHDVDAATLRAITAGYRPAILRGFVRHWPAVARAAPVIVMFMAVKHLGSITEKLLAAGRDPDDRLAIVSHAATPRQSVLETTLAQAHALTDIPTPAIVVLGPVSAYRQSLDWYVGEARRHVFG